MKATEGTGIRILDTSTAHRTKEDWVYGFPELSSEQYKAISQAQKVAVPGCHASGAISILYPLVHARNTKRKRRFRSPLPASTASPRSTSIFRRS